MNRDEPEVADRRFPSNLYSRGTEPDPRFTLANERTFPAWTRIGLFAAGVALEAISLDLHPQLRLAASLVLIASGVAAPVQAWWGWYETEHGLRMGRPLPAPRLSVPIVVLVVVVAGVLVTLSVVLR
ncbi:MAG: DUF202 domain-containing protein [Actinomycetota bacterium]|jgi:putative membrane protein|nr:DUF202 domain-containing protein [Actinomycetota bacterium]